jgi:hypothetical protein
MTNEEIFNTIKEINEELDKPSDPEKTLTEEEKRHKYILSLRKDLLEKILEARATYRGHREFSLTMTYGAVTSLGEKYPFLIPFIKAKAGIGI